MSEQQNPYVGLRPFFLKDSLHFFGRETQTAELLAVLHQHRFLGVVGSSGSGKSSLVRAGLLPALFGGFLVGERDRWRIVQIKPGDTPLRNLAAGLLSAFAEAPSSPADVAALEAAIGDEQADAVAGFVKARLTSRESLFLLVDQFEEVFACRRSGDDQRAEAADFVALLMALAEEHADVPVFVALTMRTDFLGDCDLFYGLPEIMNRGQYLVPRLTRQQLRVAIEGPAMLTGARVAPQLMDLLLNQLGDREDRLPVIQHALLRTWDAWHAAGATGSIEVRHFDEAGGLENALNIDAEAALVEVKSALPAIDDRVVTRVFKALTDTDPSHRAVRRPARVSELMAASGADRATVDTIIRCFSHKNRNFLYADGWPSAADSRVDISHESLIRQWTRLRTWVDDEREMRDEFTALVVRARSWQKHGVVLRGNELKSAEAWWKAAEPTAAWARRYSVGDNDFALAQQHLNASKKARWRTKVVWFGSAAVVTAAIVSTLGYVQRNEQRTAADTELQRDMENDATAQLQRDSESAIVSALSAADAHARLHPGAPLPLSLETILLRAWQESALVKTQPLPIGSDVEYAMLSPGGRVAVLGGAVAVDGQAGIKAYDVATGRLLASQESSALTDGCSAFSPDGSQLSFTENRISLRWSPSTGAVEEIVEFERDRRRKWVDCAYSPDASRMAFITSTHEDLDYVLTLAAVNGLRMTKIRDIRLAAKADTVTALRFSPNGDAVAAATFTEQDKTVLSIVDVKRGTVVKRLTVANPVTDLAVSLEHGLVATVENAYTYGLFLRSLDVDGPPVLFPSSGSDDDYSGLAFSPDGQQVAAAIGGTARLWDLTTGFAIEAFRGHQREILDVAFDAEGRLVTVGQDAEVRVWRAGNREKRAFQPEENLQSAVMPASGATVITTDNTGTVRGWNVENGEPLPAAFDASKVLHLAQSPDGGTLAAVTMAQDKSGGPGLFRVRLLEVRSGRLLAELNGGSELARLAFSLDGRRLALAESGGVKVWTLPPAGAQPYDLAEPVRSAAAGTPGLVFGGGVAFSPDAAGRQIATINAREVYLWNAATGACEGRIDAQSEVFSAAYVPGGWQIATGDGLGRVRFWPLGLAQLLGCDDRAGKKDRIAPERTLQEHRGPVRAITFVGDGSRFATASDDRTAKVWDAMSGRILLTLRHARAVTHAAFSAEGRLLMTTVDDQGAKLWEVPLRTEILAVARKRLTRDCLSKEERQRFFPGMPVDEPPCVTVGR